MFTCIGMNHGLFQFSGHIGCIVFGEHLVCNKTLLFHMSTDNHGLLVAKQVGKDASVDDWNGRFGIHHGKEDLQRIVAVPDGTGLDYATKAETMLLPCFTCLDLAGCEQIVHVLLECKHDQAGGQCGGRADQQNSDKSAFACALHRHGSYA